MPLGGAILDGFPRTRVQAEALDEALDEAGRRVDAAVYIDVPIEDLVQRMANRRICAANGHVYNLASNPPQVEGICDIDGSPLAQRDDDEEIDRPGPDGPAGPAAARCRRPLPVAGASCRPSTAAATSTSVTAPLLAALGLPPGGA